MALSKRLLKFKHKAFWGSGMFMHGNRNDRLAWIFCRVKEQSKHIKVNPYLR
jgi:hypothetical protein